VEISFTEIEEAFLNSLFSFFGNVHQTLIHRFHAKDKKEKHFQISCKQRETLQLNYMDECTIIWS